MHKEKFAIPLPRQLALPLADRSVIGLGTDVGVWSSKLLIGQMIEGAQGRREG